MQSIKKNDSFFVNNKMGERFTFLLFCCKGKGSLVPFGFFSEKGKQKGNRIMPITELLERNAELYGDDVALVEVNPEITEVRRVTWKEYELIEPNPECHYRREITWKVFDEKANRFANMLIERGIKKGDKVGILLMNCLEWLPI